MLSNGVVDFLCHVNKFVSYKRKHSHLICNIMYKTLLIVFFISFFIETVTSPLRGYVGTDYCSVVTFVLFFLYSVFALRKYSETIKPLTLLLVMLGGASLVQLPYRILKFEVILITLPDYLFHLLGILMGYWFYQSGKRMRAVVAALSFASCMFVFYWGNDMWEDWYSYGTATGRMEHTETQPFQFSTEQGDTITHADLKGKYIVFDFWHRYCGVCFQSFPEVERVYMRCKEQPETIALYSVNLKMEYGEGVGEFELIRNEGYSFPVLQTSDKEMLERVFGVRYFPTVVILRPDGDMVFRGDIKGAGKYIDNLLKQ